MAYPIELKRLRLWHRVLSHGSHFVMGVALKVRIGIERKKQCTNIVSEKLVNVLVISTIGKDGIHHALRLNEFNPFYPHAIAILIVNQDGTSSVSRLVSTKHALKKLTKDCRGLELSIQYVLWKSLER